MLRMDLESRNTEKFRLRRAKQKENILFDHFHEISLKKLHMTKTLKKTLHLNNVIHEAFRQPGLDFPYAIGEKLGRGGLSPGL